MPLLSVIGFYRSLPAIHRGTSRFYAPRQHPTCPLARAAKESPTYHCPLCRRTCVPARADVSPHTQDWIVNHAEWLRICDKPSQSNGSAYLPQLPSTQSAQVWAGYVSLVWGTSD